MINKIYYGNKIVSPEKSKKIEVYYIDIDGTHQLTPDLSRAVSKISSTDFDWGYEDLRSNQLSLSILLDYSNDVELSEKFYHDFKIDYVKNWGLNWRLTTKEIDEWLKIQN